jgi:3-hydroxybutyryl-CoA dehydrogenase
MKIVVRTDESMKEELLAQGLKDHVQVEWVKEWEAFPGADVFIDLLFRPVDENMEELKKLQPATVIINSVSGFPGELPGNFVRINGWRTFLKRPVVEAACLNPALRTKAENIFNCFNKTTEWVPDVPGFISARVVSMIINEAFFALQENVSTKEEIDTAMKLGTHYPYGPFEWSEKIGIENIYELLAVLSHSLNRYEPCSLVKEEALRK